MNRTATRSLLTFVAGAVVGSMVTWALVSSWSSSPAPDDGPKRLRDTSESPARAAPAPVPSAATLAQVAASPVAAAEATVEARPERGSISVRLVDAMGVAVSEFQAYALPAGARGVSGGPGEDVASTNGGGPLSVEAPGLYDVGAKAGQLVALSRDVRVRPGEVVRLDLSLPAAEHVRFVYDGPPVGDGVIQPLLEVDAPAVAHFPGRSETLEVGCWGEGLREKEVECGPFPVGLPLLAGAAVRRRDPEKDPWTVALEVEPRVVTAGDTVRIRARPGGCLRLDCAMDPAFPLDGAMPFVVAVTDERGPKSAQMLDMQYRTYDRRARRVEVAAGRVSVEWSGPAVEDGRSGPVTVAAGTTVDLTLDLRPRLRGEATAVAVSVVGVPAELLSTVQFVAPDVHGGGGWMGEAGEDDRPTLPAYWRGTGGVMAFAGAAHVSPPFEVPLRGGVEVRLEPAAALAVHSSRPAPLSIRATDRRLLCRLDGEELTEKAPEIVLRGPVTLLGALSPGPHRFEVTRNGVVLGVAEITLPAGGSAMLDLDTATRASDR